TLAAPLNEGDGRAVHMTVSGTLRELTLPTGFQWAEGRSGKKAFSLEPGETVQVPEAGDFEADQGFSWSAWVRLPRENMVGSIVARMDNANGYRGWDVWLEGNRRGMHVINAWSDNALKAVAKTPLKVNEWQHLAVAYDGSKKAAGIRIYV